MTHRQAFPSRLAFGAIAIAALLAGPASAQSLKELYEAARAYDATDRKSVV